MPFLGKSSCDFYLFGTAFSADIAAFDQLFLDLNKVFLCTCDVEGVRDGFQMLDYNIKDEYINYLKKYGFLTAFSASEIVIKVYHRKDG